MPFYYAMIKWFMKCNWMNKNTYATLLLLLAVVISCDLAIGQTRKHAFSLLDEGKVQEAQSEYYELMKTHGNDPLICFEMGIALYMGNTDDKVESVKYFELAKKNSVPGDTISELFYYLGRAYQASNDFKKAKKSYDSFESNLKEQSDKKKKQPKAIAELQTELEDYIEKCIEGLRQIRMTEKNPLTNYMITSNESRRYYIAQNEYYTVENLGPQVNSIHDDYAPVFDNNEKTIMFTSARNSRTDKKYPNGLYYEDIFISNYDGAEWGEALNIDSSDLFKKDSRKSDFHHNASVSMNSDESELYTYAYNKIYVSKKEDGKWGKPKKMGSKINNKKARQSSAVISPDGKLLLVVSDKEGGFGGSDIYYSKQKKDGVWSELVNMGNVVNTEKDEETPWMNPTMDTLFFSSKGHRNIGGFDVFFSHKLGNGNWSQPKNMGIPVNTALDELSYMESRTNSLYAYYASNRTGGHGYFDIYHISRKFEEGDDMLTAKKTLAKRDSLLEEIGNKFDEVYVKKIYESLADGQITKEEVQQLEQELAVNEPTPKSEETKEEVVPEAANEEPRQEKVTEVAEPSTTEHTPIPKETVKDSEPAQQTEIASSSTKKEPAKVVAPSPTADLDCENLMKDESSLADVHFDFNSSALGEKEKARLKSLAEDMTKNSNSILDISGHAYNQGSEEVNEVFSANRVKAVFEYMTAQGLEANRFVLNQFGESKPKVSNESSRCRAANRRVELSLTALNLYGNVYFDLNSSSLDAKDEAELKRLSSFIQNNPTAKIQLTGYTDPSGSTAYNKKLAEKRIISVQNYLIKNGISESLLTKEALGEDENLVPNYVQGSAELNRRVQIEVR